jgi:hypothetical protein
MSPHKRSECGLGFHFEEIAEKVTIGPIVAIPKVNLHGRQNGKCLPARHHGSKR